MTAVGWLVEMICRDVDMYDEEDNVNGVEYWNAFQSCTDLSEYINKAKEMEKQKAHEYAEFAIRCDRKEMKILNFEDWIKLEIFKSE